MYFLLERYRISGIFFFFFTVVLLYKRQRQIVQVVEDKKCLSHLTTTLLDLMSLCQTKRLDFCGMC